MAACNNTEGVRLAGLAEIWNSAAWKVIDHLTFAYTIRVLMRKD